MTKSKSRQTQTMELLERYTYRVNTKKQDRMYVYLLPSVLCGLIVPAEVEEAIKVCIMLPISVSVLK